MKELDKIIQLIESIQDDLDMVTDYLTNVVGVDLEESPEFQAVRNEDSVITTGSGENTIDLPNNTLSSNEPGTINMAQEESKWPLNVKGPFDGRFLIAPDEKKYEVPVNYSAKSKLVYGDTLKLTAQSPDNMRFKQINRVPRKQITGILGRRNYEWYILSHSGIFRLLDSAVKYHKGEEGEGVIALIPVEDKDCPYAALDEILRKDSSNKENGSKTDAVSSNSSQSPQKNESRPNAKNTTPKPENSTKKVVSKSSNHSTGNKQVESKQKNEPTNSDSPQATTNEVSKKSVSYEEKNPKNVNAEEVTMATDPRQLDEDDLR